MGSRRTRIPSIPEPKQDNLLKVVSAIKEVLEVAEKRRGDPLDAKVSFRDLIDAGLASAGAGLGGGGGSGNGGVLNPEIPGPNSPFLKPPTYDGLVLPGRPVNVHTMAVWDGIQVIWDWPDAAGTNTYWKRAVVWASASSQFQHATIVGYTTTNFFTHTGLGLSAPTIPGVTTLPGVRYYWVAWEGNFNETTGVADRSDPTPYHWEPGIRGQTAVDPAYTLSLLTGQIRESHLLSTLNSRISLIDYNPNDPNNRFTTSVQERILSATAGAATAGEIYAAIAETASTSVNTTDGYAEGEYSLRIDAAGYVAGYGLSAFSRMGVGGEREVGSAFMVNVDTFAIVRPIYPKKPIPGGYTPDQVIIPFIVSTIDGESYVGIDGQLIVDGSITAYSIQAGSIGTAQLNAQQVYADLLEANNIITGTLATSVNPNFRLEINGDGSSKELYPLWYGNGNTGGSGSVFYATRQGTMKLAGELYVTGAGKFFAGNTAAGEWRLELGGPSDEFMLWAGTGTKSKTNTNYAFWIDNDGNASFKGLLEAEFVSGEISRTFVIQEGFTVKPNASPVVDGVDLIASANWKTVSLGGYWTLPPPVFTVGHVPYCQVAFTLFGKGELAGAGRLQFSLTPTVESSWQTLTASAFDISMFGETKVLIGVAARVYVTSYFRFQVAGYNGFEPTTGARNGLLMGIR